MWYFIWYSLRLTQSERSELKERAYYSVTYRTKNNRYLAQYWVLTYGHRNEKCLLRATQSERSELKERAYYSVICRTQNKRYLAQYWVLTYGHRNEKCFFSPIWSIGESDPARPDPARPWRSLEAYISATN